MKMTPHTSKTVTSDIRLLLFNKLNQILFLHFMRLKSRTEYDTICVHVSENV